MVTTVLKVNEIKMLVKADPNLNFAIVSQLVKNDVPFEELLKIVKVSAKKGKSLMMEDFNGVVSEHINLGFVRDILEDLVQFKTKAKKNIEDL